MEKMNHIAGQAMLGIPKTNGHLKCLKPFQTQQNPSLKASN
jgi:hypothetical protein